MTTSSALIMEHKRKKGAIREQALRVRRYFEGPWPGSHLPLLKRFPNGCCKVASVLLMKYLVEEHGFNEVEGIANGMRIDPRDADKGWGSHFWLEHGTTIIDITADQFDDITSPVIVTTNRDWHDQFIGQKRFPYAEFRDLAEPHHMEYELLLKILRRSQGSPS